MGMTRTKIKHWLIIVEAKQEIPEVFLSHSKKFFKRYNVMFYMIYIYIIQNISFLRIAHPPCPPHPPCPSPTHPALPPTPPCPPPTHPCPSPHPPCPPPHPCLPFCPVWRSFTFSIKWVPCFCWQWWFWQSSRRAGGSGNLLYPGLLCAGCIPFLVHP